MTNFSKWLLFFCCVAFFVFIYFLLPILTPFAIAALLAYMGDPIVEKLRQWKIPRTLGVILVFIIIVIIISLFLIWLIPLLEKQIYYISQQLPKLIEWIQDDALPWLSAYFGKDIIINLASVKKTIMGSLQKTNGFTSQIIQTITQSGFAIIGIIANIILIPVVTFYLLRDWKKVVSATQGILPRSVEPTVVKLVTECNEVLGSFFRGQLLVMFSLGCIYSFGLWVIGIQLALIIGLVSGLASIVPYLGFIVGISAAWIAAFVQFKTILSLLYVFIVFMVGQAAESAVLTPLLVGDRIGLHPVAVIFAIMAGGQLFGFVGVLLALPVSAVIMVLLRFAREKYVNSQLYT